jgi:hypothetical protein
MVALGGSITAGHGVTVANDSYVTRLYSWIQACACSSISTTFA